MAMAMARPSQAHRPYRTRADQTEQTDDAGWQSEWEQLVCTGERKYACLLGLLDAGSGTVAWQMLRPRNSIMASSLSRVGQVGQTAKKNVSVVS